MQCSRGSSLLIVNFGLQFDNLLSQSQLRSNGALKGDADANWELKIIKAKIGVVKPLLNEVVQDVHIEEGQIIEDLRLLLALYQLLKSIISTIII